MILFSFWNPNFTLAPREVSKPVAPVEPVEGAKRKALELFESFFVFLWSAPSTGATSIAPARILEHKINQQMNYQNIKVLCGAINIRVPNNLY